MNYGHIFLIMFLVAYGLMTFIPSPLDRRFLAILALISGILMALGL